MKHPLPLRRYRFASDASLAPFLNLLREAIGDGTRDDSPPGAVPFVYRGRAGGEGFEIDRINAYRSTYMPFIKGRFFAGEAGTAVEVTMRPHRQIFVFSAVWYFFLLSVSLLILLSADGDHLARFFLLALPLGLAVSTWLLTLSVFESDCRWARKSLEETLFLRSTSG
jgi:hypothetical protein